MEERKAGTRSFLTAMTSGQDTCEWVSWARDVRDAIASYPGALVLRAQASGETRLQYLSRSCYISSVGERLARFRSSGRQTEEWKARG